MTVRRLPALLALILCAAPAVAEPPRLGLPLLCTPGEDCFVNRYLDHDPGPGFRDYACGDLGSDAHGGTDFAVPGEASVIRGVPVVAAADGTVRGVRDGMADVDVTTIGGVAALEGRDCGNGVVLAHPDGWETQYCHMRRGSVAVGGGDAVRAGQTLGMVGMSGAASFPHVHLSVRRNGAGVDPFLGPDGRAGACRPGERPLWRDEVLAALVDRPRFWLARAGFAPVAPEMDDARWGRHDAASLGRDAPALVLWLDAYEVRPGDRVRLRITGPDGGEVVARSETVGRDLRRLFLFAGDRRREEEGLWPAGRYEGEAALERAGVVQTRRVAVELR